MRNVILMIALAIICYELLAKQPKDCRQQVDEVAALLEDGIHALDLASMRLQVGQDTDEVIAAIEAAADRLHAAERDRRLR